MSQFLYPHARSAFAKGEIDWSSDAFLVILTGPSYTLDPTAVYRDEVTALATASLAGMAVLDNGVCDANDCSVSGVTAATSVGGVLICHDTGSDTTDRLIYATDVHTDGTSILRVSDGNPIVVSWSNGTGRIFQL